MNHKKHIAARDWTLPEVVELIALYQYFLKQQTADIKYQKAAPVRHLMAKLNRTRGSVEGKLMNISGVLKALNMSHCIVKGYAPTSNYAVDMIDPVKAGFEKFIKEAA